MEHAINTIQKRPANLEYNLIESVYAIIDSRMQYLEYQNDRLFKSYLRNGKKRSKQDVLKLDLRKESRYLLNNFEELLNKLSVSSKSVKLLLMLRNCLEKENAGLILELLTDNRYLDISEDRLGILLNKAAFS